MGANSNNDPSELAIYVHWPFCQSKCPYCDFNSHVRHGGIDEAAFRDGFLSELDHHRQWLGPRVITSIFFGGGTPSLMHPGTVAAILERIGRHWSVAGDAEITLEANPSSVEADRFKGYHTAGVNRVSLGVQSLRDPDLKALGRLHNVEDARAAVAIATRTFERVSFDLIYARPHQTHTAWRDELAEALDMSAGHLSLYQLTIEPATPFADLYRAGKLVIPNDDQAVAFYEQTQSQCQDSGLAAYEISNHARPGDESRHNLTYWRYGEYIGIGPGAHGRPIISGERIATHMIRNPEQWLAKTLANGHGMVENTPLSLPEQRDEFLLMGLRLTDGIDLADLAEFGGNNLQANAFQQLVDAGMVDLVRVEDQVTHSSSSTRLAITPRGRLILNDLIAEVATLAG